MFGLASGIYQSYFAPPKLSILIIGLDGSGKTALLERIKVTSFAARTDNSAHPDGRPTVGAVAGNLEEGVLKRGAKPARLPPPLPPDKVQESRRWIDEMLAANETQHELLDDQNHEQTALLQGIPPPPLCGLDTPESSNGTRGPSDTIKSTISANSSQQRSPLPTKTGLSKPNNPTTTPTSTPSKRSSFIELLRCPSPGRYSTNIQEDEEYNAAIHASAISAICTSSQKNLLNPESESNTNYLNDYFIDFSPDEMFDVKVLKGKEMKMFPLERIRPTLGQNLAKVDICGCKCSLFDLSGTEKMRPLWERYFRDTDAVIYVVDSCGQFENVRSSSVEFDKLCKNEVLRRRLELGLPLMIFANGLDLAYGEYDRAVQKVNEVDQKRQVSWNPDEEDAFVGGKQQQRRAEKKDDKDYVSNRVVDYCDLLKLFGITSSQTLNMTESKIKVGVTDDAAQCNGDHSDYSIHAKGNIFLFGGSAKTGEGVKSAMEYLVTQSKKHHLVMNSQ